MALTINGIDILKQYCNGVIERADHHADNVNAIALALIGGVIWKASEDVVVKEYAGSPANVLWMIVNGKRYCFSFNHSTWVIDVREDSIRGKVLASFDNNTTVNDVRTFFKSL